MAHNVDVARRPRSRYSNSAAARRKRAGWTPFVAPTRPPPGSYDPSLDAQDRASQRGLGDLQQDTEKANTRATNDYSLGMNDIGTSHDRSWADILRGRTRGTEDYGQQVQGLDREYVNRASNQLQSGNAAGLEGGYEQQAAQKRATNYGLERAPVDQSYKRFMDDSSLAEKLLNENTDDAKGRLTLGYERGNEDRLTALTHATRETGIFGQDIAGARFYSARGSDYQPPTMPSDERNKSGLQYKILGGGKYLTTGGRVIGHAELARRHKIWRDRARKNPAIIPPRPLY